jgi:hypothetical protein
MRRGFHGLVIEDGVIDEAHPLAAFFAHFPPDESDAKPTLTLSVRRQRRLPRHDLRAPLFFHGVVQVSASASGFLAEAPDLQVQLSRDARQLELIVRSQNNTNPPYAAGIVHVMLLFALRFHGLFDLHAGAALVARGDGLRPATVLVVGESGSGKTTTTLALGQRLGVLGDDRLLVREPDPRQLLAYPRALHLGDITRDLFPELDARMVLGESKREAEIPPGRLVLAAPAASALILPQITSSPTTQISPATQGEVYGALLEASAIAFVESVPGRDANLVCLKSLAEIPSFHLALGQDARNTSEPIRRLVGEKLAQLTRTAGSW